jgi:sodium/potassium/calcium exchanger 2
LYTHTLAQHKQEHFEAAEEEEDEGVSMEIPDGIIPKINWVLLLPITFPLYVTVPDVRWHSGKCVKSYQSCYMVTFILSILWIAIYSFFMVWFITCLGDFMGLSQEVMGVTFLAAGTSVPDLISSVLVAQEGHGDMAVSSSIGSNIFDVTVGLPLPWIIHQFVYGPVQLGSKGALFFSLLLLLGMLLSIVLTIIFCKYRMTKGLGATMFALYIVFIAIDLLRNSGVIKIDW